MKRDRLFLWVAKSLLTVMVLILGLALISCAQQNPSPSGAGDIVSPTPLQATSGNTAAPTDQLPQASAGAPAKGTDLVIPIQDITDKATFYPVEIDGTKMEVIAVKAPDGTIRTAFNTCQVCYDSGRGYYKQEGDVLVCQNCGNRFPMSRVEVEAGGCNPWPIFAKNKTVTDASITISYDFLKASREIFANWKQA